MTIDEKVSKVKMSEKSYISDSKDEEVVNDSIVPATQSDAPSTPKNGNSTCTGLGEQLQNLKLSPLPLEAEDEEVDGQKTNTVPAATTPPSRARPSAITTRLEDIDMTMMNKNSNDESLSPVPPRSPFHRFSTIQIDGNDDDDDDDDDDDKQHGQIKNGNNAVLFQQDHRNGIMVSASGKHSSVPYYDLTPVMRNTTSIDGLGMDDHDSAGKNRNSDAIFDAHETLALPSDLSGRPPMPVHQSLRAKSIGCFTKVYDSSPTTTTVVPLPPPIELSRQSYSFTSRQQYDEHEMQHDKVTNNNNVYYDVHSLSSAQHPPNAAKNLIPYQPTRRQYLDDSVEELPQEEINQIFLQRRRASSNSISAPIPLEERTWSIPSIRMANPFGGSVTSHDDEDSILRYLDDDDESLSSRGSLHNNNNNSFVSSPWMIAPVSESIMEHAIPKSTSFDQDTTAAHKHRLLVPSSTSRAMEWLHSVEASEDVFAEAASSKFLLRSPERTHYGNEYPYIRRQCSSPPTMETTAPMDAV